MTPPKNRTRLQVWVDDGLRGALQQMAAEENRSVSNLVESYLKTAVGVWARSKMSVSLDQAVLGRLVGPRPDDGPPLR